MRSGYALLASVAVALAACAAPAEEARAPSVLPTAVAAQSLLPAAVAAQPRPRPRLWYVGLGMQGETWSENDVVQAAEQLQVAAPGFDVRPALFSNRIAATSEHYPAVEGRSVEAAVASIAAQAGPDDVVLVYASTHGAPGLLGRGAAGFPLKPIGVDEVQRWLAPLGERDTVLVLSACFAGSFIPALKSEHRIIFTAARADRTSFGCQAGAEHTVFGEAFLQALAPEESLHVIVNRTRAAVRAREHEMHVDDPSLPQISVGRKVRRLYEARLF